MNGEDRGCGICGRTRCTCRVDLEVWDRITRATLARARIEVLRALLAADQRKEK